MALVRSHVFIAVSLASQSVLVPGGKRWLVKYAVFYNNSVSSATWTIAVTVAGGTQRTLFTGTVASAGSAILPMPFTLDAGDRLHLNSNVGTTVVHASGIEFTP